MLFLIERAMDRVDEGAIQPLLSEVSAAVRAAGGELIETQVSVTLGRAYVIVEHESRDRIEAYLRVHNVPFESLDEVRLVGADLEAVKASRGSAQYLVEWDFPPTLTMDRYLARKKEKGPLYAQIPEVQFLRTYVREDMTKCLCLYNGPDTESICRAREIVDTPISRLSTLAETRERVS
ncbi:MAG: DUF4242 domain-containing protein [Chloroflexi bacterium]|nr:DUF4242 domain-containing protein [Chloroflexota bacterium]